MTFGMQKDCEINLDFAGGVLDKVIRKKAVPK